MTDTQKIYDKASILSGMDAVFNDVVEWYLNYDKDLDDRYHSHLGSGAKASGAYLPKKVEFSREQMEVKWLGIKDLFHKNLSPCTEAQLDKHRMPHPILGKITVREMLFFTILHTRHHLDSLGRDYGA